MANEQRISVSEERLNLALATLRLEITKEMNASEERTRTRFEQIRTDIAGNPATIAGLKANVADLQDDVDYLSKRDWWAGGLVLVVATFISWLTGNK